LSDGVGVDPVEREVHDEPRAPLALGDDTERRETEIGKLLDQVERKDRPEAFLNKIRHLVADEVGVIGSGGMRAALQASLQVSGRPLRGVEHDIGAALT
jgi:hypothetical protein